MKARIMKRIRKGMHKAAFPSVSAYISYSFLSPERCCGKKEFINNNSEFVIIIKHKEHF